MICSTFLNLNIPTSLYLGTGSFTGSRPSSSNLLANLFASFINEHISQKELNEGISPSGRLWPADRRTVEQGSRLEPQNSRLEILYCSVVMEQAFGFPCLSLHVSSLGIVPDSHSPTKFFAIVVCGRKARGESSSYTVLSTYLTSRWNGFSRRGSLTVYENQNTLPEGASTHSCWSVGLHSWRHEANCQCAFLYRLALALFGDLPSPFRLALWHVMFPSAGAKLFSLWEILL